MKAEILAMVEETRQSAENVISMANKLSDLISRIPAIPALLTSPSEDKVTLPVEAVPQVPQTVSVTLEVLRIALAEKARAGFTNEIKSLIAKYDAEKLPELAPAHYAALLAEVERLE